MSDVDLSRLIDATRESVRLLQARLASSAIPEDGWDFGGLLAEKQQLLSLATEVEELRYLQSEERERCIEAVKQAALRLGGQPISGGVVDQIVSIIMGLGKK